MMWTWHQIAHDALTLISAIIVVVCLTMLSHRSYKVVQQQHRFRLRDMFLVLTLIAGLAGLFVGLAHQEQHGIPNMDYWSVYHRESSVKHDK
jgi:hypothetical protein